MKDFRVLDALLTECDESIRADLNIDPLGLLVGNRRRTQGRAYFLEIHIAAW